MLISNLKHIFGGFIEQVMGKKASISQGGQQVAGFFFSLYKKISSKRFVIYCKITFTSNTHVIVTLLI